MSPAVKVCECVCECDCVYLDGLVVR